MEQLQGVKTAVAVALATFTSAAASWLQLLQPWLTAIGTLAGGALSLVLAYNHWKSGRLERQKLRMENEKLRRSLGLRPSELPVEDD